MARFLTPSVVCSILGIPRPTLVSWGQRGIAKPDIPSPGKGTPNLYSPYKIWAIGVGRALRQAGEDFDLAVSVTQTLSEFRPEYVQDSFALGRDHLLSVNGLIMPRLTTRDGIDNSEMTRLEKTAEAHGQSASCVGLK